MSGHEGFLFEIIPDDHEDQADIEHNCKRYGKSKVDGVQTF